MMRTIRAALVLLLLVVSPALARADALQMELERLLATKKADVGVAVYGLEDGYSLSVNGQTRYPMQSVFKFHIALTVLGLVDKGTLHLEQKIRIAQKDLKPNTWSPIRDKHPQGGAELTLAEILRYTVAESDNNGCDILLRLVGGPEAVSRHIHGLGVTDVSIRFNEDEMHQKWERQFSNWTTPEAAAGLLANFYKRKFLEREQFDFLWKVMLETVTGGGRIKGMLPAGTPVAHKTGTSGVNGKGVMAAVNDIGVVTLPDGRHFAIAVFVANSREKIVDNERTIAEVSKAVWDHFEGTAR